MQASAVISHIQGNSGESNSGASLPVTLAASSRTSYSYRVRVTDAPGNLVTFSNASTATTAAAVDTTPPSAPGALAASVVSTTQINLSWAASTDNVGVAGYRVERCQGANCTSFIQVATAAANPQPPVISSPASGTVVTAGQEVTITSSVVAGTFPNGVALVAAPPLGGGSIQYPSGSSVTLSLSSSAQMTPGPQSVYVVGMDAGGVLYQSLPLQLIFERPHQPISFAVRPAVLTLSYIGENQPLTVFATLGDGSMLETTLSSRVQITSENTSIATVTSGTVTARGSGQTSIDIAFGSMTTKVPVNVLYVIQGDLNGDGIVDQSDANILIAHYGSPTIGATDARDLNQDGVIDALDLKVLQSKCTHPGCTPQ